MSIVYWLAGGILLAIAWTDAKKHEIPDLLVALLMCCGIVRAIFENRPLEMLVGLLLCGLPILHISISLKKGFIGGADVKLCATLGAFLGPLDGLLVLSGAVIFLSIFGLVKRAWKEHIPFAPFVFPAYVIFIFTMKGLS